MKDSCRLRDAMARAACEVEDSLKALLPATGRKGSGAGLEERLFDAMAYATAAGGKRLRPFLVLAANDLFGGPRPRALRVAAAIEMIHCYSLAHDDLPAMDDDDLRRGRPSCHKRYDEATAVLAGDALLTLAFAVLSDPATHDDAAVRCALIAELARRSGAYGMVGGQMFDLEAQGKVLCKADIERLQRMKTGDLLAFSVIGGALLNRADAQVLARLSAYAADIGLAFQMTDDLLDATGTAGSLGKRAGKDEAAGKATFVSLLGIEETSARARALAARGEGHLKNWDERADTLRALARFIVERDA